MNESAPRVLVTDGETRAALAVVRSLGRAGYDVSVVATRLPSLASSSRFARRSAQVTPPSKDPAATAAELAAIADDWRIQVVLPVADATMGTILKYGGGPAAVAGPSLAAYEAIADKSALLARAASLGCLTPRTAIARQSGELQEAIATAGFPCVLKPHRSFVVGHANGGNPGVRYLENGRNPVPQYPEAAYPILVQERIVGPAEGIFLVTDRGQPIAAFAHRRLREKPPAGGVSTYRESIALPPDLLCVAERLLAESGWRGAAMVEFKRSARTGRGYLMEINGRLWGSLQLAIEAGVDFPVLVVRLALGQQVSPVSSYRIGVRMRWFWGDVDHLIARVRHSRKQLHLGPDAPSLLATARDVLRFRRPGERSEVWDRDDPRPFWRETADWLRGRSA
jgi:predicted ATP-grasp superfamily ATP-dependent carboligase